MRHELMLTSTRTKMIASMMTTLILSTTGPIPAVMADHCSSPKSNSSQVSVNRIDTSSSQKIPKLPDHPVNVKTGPREVHNFVAKLSFSARPTDLELSTAHVLPELLVPLTEAQSAQENMALAQSAPCIPQQKQ